MTKDTLEACRRYLQIQFLRPEFGRRGEKGACFLTLSRQAGAGGITVGRLLEAYLREHDGREGGAWTLFDKNLVNEVIREHGLSEKFAEFLNEEKISELKEMVDETLNLRPSDLTLVRKTSETILHLAAVGHVILVGRGANILTRKLPGGFHVRLIGSFAKRVRHVQDYYGFDAKKSGEFVRKEDADRKHYVKTYLNADIDDPLLYDLVLNTDGISYAAAARIIAHAASAKED